MSDEQSKRPKVRRLWKFVAFGAIGLVVLAICLGVAILRARAEKRQAWAEIQERLDAIRAAGEPVTADDLAKLYPDPPPDQDAKLLLAPAIAALREPDESNDVPFLGSGELPPRSVALGEHTKTNIEAIITDNQVALSAIHWDKITNAWIGSGFALGFVMMPDDDMHPVSVLTRLLYLKALVEAESDNGANAADALNDSLELANTLRSDGLTHHLMRRAEEARFCEVLERVVNRTRVSATDLLKLERALSDDPADGLGGAVMSVRCEDISGMITARDVDNDTLYGLSNHRIGEGKAERAIKSASYATLLRISGKVYSDTEFFNLLELRAAQLAALRLPPKLCFAQFDRQVDLATNIGSHGTLASELTIAALDFSKLVRRDWEVLAKLEVSRVALEVERWRLAHGGRVPDSLADLVPDFAPSVPLDPFDGKPLRYKKLARGFVVYSIGADFTDDGGKEKKDDSADMEHYDITFTVER